MVETASRSPAEAGCRWRFAAFHHQLKLVADGESAEADRHETEPLTYDRYERLFVHPRDKVRISQMNPFYREACRLETMATANPIILAMGPAVLIRRILR